MTKLVSIGMLLVVLCGAKGTMSSFLLPFFLGHEKGGGGGGGEPFNYS